ncbi:hypothetical protein PV328_003811, partial [Microctonus aethiopoides]
DWMNFRGPAGQMLPSCTTQQTRQDTIFRKQYFGEFFEKNRKIQTVSKSTF